MDLQLQGITFALDDFGAGYTSFRYLKRVQLRHPEDRRSVRPRRRGRDADNQVLAQALVSIGRISTC
jgi:EAL domain-containing protein (putative c-di-GMP-specific phosphodiesterase class I)